MQSMTTCCDLHFTEAGTIELRNYSPLICKPPSLFVGQDERHWKKGTPKERNPVRHIPRLLLSCHPHLRLCVPGCNSSAELTE